MYRRWKKMHDTILDFYLGNEELLADVNREQPIYRQTANLRNRDYVPSPATDISPTQKILGDQLPPFTV